MSLKWKEISKLIEEAEPTLLGAVVQKIAQIKQVANGDSLLFHGFSERGGAWRVWACFQQDHTFWALLPADLKLEAKSEPSTFIMVLRKHLLGKTIQKIEQLRGERVMLWHFSQHTLVFELLPKKANLLLIENWNPASRSGRCLHSFRKVSLLPGGIYELAPMPMVQISEVIREFSTTGSYHQAVAEHYFNLVSETGFQGWQRQWRQAWKSFGKKIHTAYENTKKDLDVAKEAAQYQRMGMALVSQLYELGPKNFPKEKTMLLGDIELKLDISKSYSENSDLFFKKAKKSQRAEGELEQRLALLEKKVSLIQEVAKKIEEAESEDELLALKDDFLKEGVPLPIKSDEQEKKQVGQAKLFLEIASSDGFRVLCGRNQQENRRVTFHESKGNDIWMHVKGMPGAHVVIKSQKNKTVPLATLLEAAQLCLFHSKIRKGKRAEVDYTARKYVKPIKGTIAEVTYTENKSLYMEADPEVLKKIMKSS